MSNLLEVVTDRYSGMIRLERGGRVLAVVRIVGDHGAEVVDFLRDRELHHLLDEYRKALREERRAR